MADTDDSRRVAGSGRVSSIDVSRQLLPLRRAERLTNCFLYWLPVSSFPVPTEQRGWLNLFLERLSQVLKTQFGLRSEVFLQLKAIYPFLSERFLENSLDLIPIIGMGRKPGVALPPIPTMEDLKPLMDGRKKFALDDYVGDYAYWFLGKDEKKERELFLGYGGLTFAFLPPDPGIKAEKVPISARLRQHPVFRDLFEQIDPDQVVARGRALGDTFLKKTMELYGGDLPDCAQTRGVRFIVPLLSSANFFETSKESKKLFEFCEVYINESPVDRGILFAFKDDLQDALIGILQEMRDGKMHYPER